MVSFNGMNSLLILKNTKQHGSNYTRQPTHIPLLLFTHTGFWGQRKVGRRRRKWGRVRGGQGHGGLGDSGFPGRMHTQPSLSLWKPWCPLCSHCNSPGPCQSRLPWLQGLFHFVSLTVETRFLKFPGLERRSVTKAVAGSLTKSLSRF